MTSPDTRLQRFEQGYAVPSQIVGIGSGTKLTAGNVWIVTLALATGATVVIYEVTVGNHADGRSKTEEVMQRVVKSIDGYKSGKA